jgi:hypothetical protein
MKILSKEFQVKTKSRFESIDITDLVQESIKRCEMKGVSLCYSKNTQLVQ